jgi:hypothetical protein
VIQTALSRDSSFAFAGFATKAVRVRGARSSRLLFRITAACTALGLLATPLAATAAGWKARKLGCHGKTAAVAKMKCHESARPAPARKLGCHGSPAAVRATAATAAEHGKSEKAQQGCCCRKFGAISASPCGCRHDGGPVMTHDSAVLPAVVPLRAARVHTPIAPWVPNEPCSARLAPPDPPPQPLPLI